MTTKYFGRNNADYYTFGGGLAIIYNIKEKCHHFVVPASIEIDKEYKVVGIWEESPEICINGCEQVPNVERNYADIIDFEDSTLINYVPTSFIHKCTSIINLPSGIKRIKSDSIPNNDPTYYGFMWPIALVDKENRFVSAIKNGCVLNHHPLELVHQYHYKHHLKIRETVRFIALAAFSFDLDLVSIVIPPSVEIINKLAFYSCYRLKKVIFSGISRLKTIKESAFQNTSISHFEIPSSVKKIGNAAFFMTESTFFIPEDSRLEKIGELAFSYTNIESIDFPANIKIIGNRAFLSCRHLKTVTFRNKSNLKKMGRDVFEMTPYENIIYSLKNSS